MEKIFFKIIRLIGLPYFFRFFFQKNKVSILTYHDISAETAEKHFSYLIKKYNVISLQDFIEALYQNKMNKLPKMALVIVFDDGHAGNYSLLPIFKKYKIPVTIFLNSGIINTKRHYWFKFNQSKYSLEKLKKVSYKEKLHLLQEVGFEREKEYETRQSLSKNEILEMSEWVDMQCHTVFHPCLPNCDSDEAKFQISQCKSILEKEYGFKVNAFAFPNGDFTEREISICKNAGYLVALTTEVGFNCEKVHPYKIKRLDSNDTDNMDEFIVKSSGANLLFKPKNLLKELLSY